MLHLPVHKTHGQDQNEDINEVHHQWMASQEVTHCPGGIALCICNDLIDSSTLRPQSHLHEPAGFYLLENSPYQTRGGGVGVNPQRASVMLKSNGCFCQWI